MKLLFDPKTFKLFDFTTNTPTELIYHYTNSTEAYNRFEKSFYQIAPNQLYVANVPKDIFSPKIYSEILNYITDKNDFISGYTKGQSDGYNHEQRIYFSTSKISSWSYLLGYEYGILTGCYLKNHP
ncbi:MAG: hypothetical protein E7314_00065 [Clostridiales bacterium]|nr:hypothetical protein [Clostridiales bacterium]